MKAIFQLGGGWPVILLALACGISGAVASGMTEDQIWFLWGFGIDLALIAGYVLTNDEKVPDDPDDRPLAEGAESGSPTVNAKDAENAAPGATGATKEDGAESASADGGNQEKAAPTTEASPPAATPVAA